ncbi:MAG: hypothetical protein AMQ22_00064 [Candidatus Methanofastidiosum methylothiophilum]|uniref:Uncharacterized protein n=1 Tax=Candidatus Methanofastidiosum methylothiophilum TaxID=1705564 RepID=A0A150J9Q1_9EURY|nr:MAG: hypothetical protein AMQ22_00064 [Candidatus Methanofastidiosum methylthiophilus]
MIGNWNIGGFIPSNVVTWDYTSKEVILNCASFKKPDGSDPTEEIFQIMDKITSGYDNTSVLSAGTVLQTYLPDDVLIISDGFETFLGTVENVIPVEDKWADEVIYYQIKLAKYIPPKEPIEAEILPDGDERTWDDDWELGYEKYNPACDISAGESSENGLNTYPNNYNTYRPLGTYQDVNVYRHEYMEGAVYDPRYGYLLPEGIRHTIPYDITGYTVVIDAEVKDHIALSTDYLGKGTQMVGAFGEEIPADTWGSEWETTHPVLRVNSTDFEFNRAGVGGQIGLSQDAWINNLDSDKLVLSVEKTSQTPGIFVLQSISIPSSGGENGGGVTSVVSDKCVTKAGGSSTQPNMIKTSGGFAGGGAWKTTGVSIGAGMGPISVVQVGVSSKSSGGGMGG